MLPFAITALSALGMYASLFLLRKWIRARGGNVLEPSVVKTRYVTLVPGIPNMFLGLAFYALAAIAAWVHVQTVCIAAFGASLLALGASAYLAYRLKYTLRMACPYCWTAHAVNGALVLLLAARCYLFG